LREVRLGRLVFRNDVGVAVWGYSLLNTAATGWGNSGASSTLELASGDGWVEYTATDLSASRTLGLSNGDASRNYNEIDFGLSAWNNSLWAHQNGSQISSCCGSFAMGARLRIAVEGGVVKYRKNGALLATSSQTVQYPLLVDTALNTSGTSLTDIVVSPSFTSSKLILPPPALAAGAGDYNLAQSV